MTLSTDALVLGLGDFRNSKSTLSFGGEGATMRTTSRARLALGELVREGYAETCAPLDQISGREHYKGTGKESFLGQIAKEAGLDLFNVKRWTSFEQISDDPAAPKGRISIEFS